MPISVRSYTRGESRTVALLLLIDILHDLVTLALAADHLLFRVLRVLEGLHLSLPGHIIRFKVCVGTRETGGRRGRGPESRDEGRSVAALKEVATRPQARRGQLQSGKI